MATTGQRLSQYQILEKLGEGGMGEVFRARDTTLSRDVAIKVLPPAFVQDPDRLTRFQREAEALAALNHTNIAQIFGLLDADGTRAIAMELVDGETVADRIGRGPIPIAEAVPIALQIADALEAAHERGIVHRDLKPANIKVRDDGVVKVLDFGLAKAMTPDPSTSGGTTQATMTSPATQIGIILGTAAYMSPEQARGRPVDRRTDMWAFGCVLYEMLTGRRAFEGEDVTETLGRVLERSPDLSRLPADTPTAIRRLLRRCFEKTPRDRTPGAASARLEIKDALAPVLDETNPVRPRGGRSWQRPLAGAVILTVLGATAWFASWVLAAPHRGLARYDVMLPEGTAYPRELAGVAVSPSGTVVFVAEQAGTRYLFRRAPEDFVATRIAGTEHAYLPFVSPDGQWVGFFTRPEHSIKRVNLSGGPVATMYQFTATAGQWGQGGAVDDSGRLTFGTHNAGLFRLISGAGGSGPDAVTSASQQGPHRFPHLLPDGGIVFTIGRTPAANRIAVRPVGGSEWRDLARGTDARYTPTGHLVFWRDGNLWAARFDPNQARLIGDPVSVVEGVHVSNNGHASYSWSSVGALMYVEAEDPPARSLAWVTSDGTEIPLDRVTPGPYGRPYLSADGQRVLLTRVDPSGEDVYLHDIDRGLTIPVAHEPYSEFYAVWWPGQDRFVFASAETGRFTLFSRSPDGAGKAEPFGGGVAGQPDDWTPDGRRLILENGGELSVYSLDTRRAEPLLSQPGVFFNNARVSPDNRWLAYQSTELPGRTEVFVRPLAAPHLPRVQVSVDGGAYPVWNADGTEVFYRKGTAVMRARVKAGATSATVVGEPEELFARPDHFSPAFDYDPIGNRFLMIKEPTARTSVPRRVVVILNWFDELKKMASR